HRPGVGPGHRRTGGDLLFLPARVQRSGYRRERHRAAAPVPAHPRGPVRGGGRGPGRDRWPRQVFRSFPQRLLRPGWLRRQGLGPEWLGPGPVARQWWPGPERLARTWRFLRQWLRRRAIGPSSPQAPPHPWRAAGPAAELDRRPLERRPGERTRFGGERLG